MEYYVFYSGDKELLAITVKGSFAGELQATKELLAHDHHIKPDDIVVKTEKRNTKGMVINMKSERFKEVLGYTIGKCVNTLSFKAVEYATEDRLHNFKVAAEIQNCTPITALAGMMAKHTVSVYDLIRKQENGFVVSREMWDEKIGDSINYLILLSALVQEKFDEESEGACMRNE